MDYNHLFHPDPTETLTKITENCILCSVNKKDMYFILKNNVIICTKKIIKEAHGKYMMNLSNITYN